MWGAYVWDKNTSASVCAKNGGGGGPYVGEGAYLQDTMVYFLLDCFFFSLSLS